MSVNSLCYRCRHYDWAVLVGGDEAVWSDECHAPGERRAGDDVHICPDFAQAGRMPDEVVIEG